MAFYAELTEGNNDRRWWQANTDRYRASVRQPMEELLDALEGEFGPGRVYRPNRDLRFTTDKSPYKDHQGALVEVDPGVGYYVQVSADGLLTGAGFFPASPDRLRLLRAGIDDDTSGEVLRGILDALTATTHGGAPWTVGGERLQTRPRGFPADHPRLDLLRHRVLTVTRSHGEPEWLDTPEVVDRVRDDWRDVRPLVAWLTEHAGSATQPHATA